MRRMVLSATFMYLTASNAGQRRQAAPHLRRGLGVPGHAHVGPLLQREGAQGVHVELRRLHLEVPHRRHHPAGREPEEVAQLDGALLQRGGDVHPLALEEAGSSLEHIVKTNIYLKNRDDYDIMRQTEREYWSKYAPALLEEPPASTFMQPVSLSKPSMLIEIEVIAVIRDK